MILDRQVRGQPECASPERRSARRAFLGGRPRASVRVAAVAIGLGALASAPVPRECRSAPADSSVAAADTLPRHVRKRLSLYRDHPSVRDVRRELEKWESAGGPHSAADSIAVAALWRRAGQVRSALEALPAVRDPAGTTRPLVSLEKARILLQAPASGPGVPGTAAERLADGGDAFWLACERMDGETKRALWRDLRGLATPAEQEEWEAVEAGPAACDRVRLLVDERAFRMAVSPEERLRLHYARLHEARHRYYIRTPRLTRDLADHLGRADSLEIDDRGLILLRMGEPLATVAPFMALNETWVYYRPAGPRVFHFAPVSKTGLNALGDFRLLENLAHASGLTMPSDLLGVGGGQLAYLYQSRRALDFLFEDPRFRRMDTRMRAARGRFNPGFQGFLAWERTINEADARYAVSGVPDAPAVAPVVEFAYEALRFREAGSDRSEVWLLAAARVGDLTASMASEPGGGLTVQVHGDLAFLSRGRMRRESDVTRAVLADPLEADDGLSVRFRLLLEPDVYPYTLVLRDRGAEHGDAGNWALDTVVVSPPQEGLPAVSDIAVAADSGGSWSRDGSTYLRVGPAHVVASDGTAHAYFEVYGIRPGGRYDVEVRVVADAAAGRLFDADGPDLAFVLSFPSTAADDGAGRGLGRHHLRVELGESAPGAYLLAVRVTDRGTGVASLPAVTPLYRPDRQASHWTEAPRRRATIVDP